MGMNDTLHELGDGLGYFIDTIKDPVGNFVLLLAIVGGIVAIFLGIATVVKKAINKSTR